MALHAQRLAVLGQERALGSWQQGAGFDKTHRDYALPGTRGWRWIFQHLLKKWQVEPDQEFSVKEKGIA